MIKVVKNIILSKLGFPRPISGIFWVTNRCNSKCTMCGIWHDKNKKDISIERFEQLFSKSKMLQNLNSITFTGGEPFLREDLDKFVDVALKYAHPMQIRISTNGFLTDKIIKFTEDMLKKHKNLKLSIKISIDGLENTHNKIRGVPDAFKKAMASLKGMNEIKQDYKNRLHLGISFTVTSENYKEINEIRDLALQNNWEFFYKPCMEAKLYNNSDKLDKKLFVKPEQAENLIQFNKKLFGDLKKQGLLTRLVDKNYYKLLIKYLENPVRLIKCYSGTSSFHVGFDGDVLPCQSLNLPMGNINKQDFDDIWFSKKAKDVRNIVKNSKCHCITSCDTSVSIIVDKFPLY